MKKLVVALLVLAAAALGWGVLRKHSPPKINFAAAKRTTLTSTLPTNGKVEPFEWQAMRAERAGVISSVAVREGQEVRKDEVIASISDPSLQSDVQGAEARVAEARANLSALENGGKPAELVEIENSLKQARLELEQEQKNYAALDRLVQKQAATSQEATAARQKMEQTQAVIEGLERRRQSLVAKSDVAAAQARLQDAQSALHLAQERAAQGVVRAPMGGTIYGLVARAGGYVNLGDLLANVGQLGRLRVRLYVDEPELGRVSEGQPVTITWEALTGKEWKGSVERKPGSIQPLGTRQVGEVICWIDNPGHQLIPGTNVDATIRTAVVENALVIPKETLRRDTQGTFVFRLDGDKVERRAVKTGNSSISEVQVTEGLNPGDAVALPTDVPLKAGDRVTPLIAGNGLG
ncbi:MAG TPA: efflux RND transporter periplasmic adaptor subunit [Bryobacteraceae bacterium]|nr:efflux RND transporter periplasmic adaptor subunit [Bryobacteraceae bacterium]